MTSVAIEIVIPYQWRPQLFTKVLKRPSKGSLGLHRQNALIRTEAQTLSI
jgi:hypothetical protein